MHSRMWVEFIRPACGSASPPKYARDSECVSASNMLLYVGYNTFSSPGLAGVLRHPEGAPGELAVSDLCPRRPAQVSPLPQEGRGPQAYPQWNQVGPR